MAILSIAIILAIFPAILIFRKEPRLRLFDVQPIWVQLVKNSTIRMTDVTKSIT